MRRRRRPVWDSLAKVTDVEKRFLYMGSRAFLQVGAVSDTVGIFYNLGLVKMAKMLLTLIYKLWHGWCK